MATGKNKAHLKIFKQGGGIEKHQRLYNQQSGKK